MLPKGVLGREYYRRLYIYSDNKINFKQIKSTASIPLDEAETNNWIKIDL
jgi:ribosomal protein L13